MTLFILVSKFFSIAVAGGGGSDGGGVCVCILTEIFEKENSVKGTFHSRKILTFTEQNKAFGAPLSLTSLYHQRKAQR